MLRALLLALTLAAPDAPAQAPSNVLSMGVGSQKIISLPSIKWIALTDDKVAEVKPIGSKYVLVVGLAEGRSRLLTATVDGRRFDYEVVIHRDMGCGIFELRKLLVDMDGVQYRMVGDRIYLEGVVRSGDEADRLRQLTALYPNVKSFVKADPQAVERAARAANDALAKQGLSRVKATVAGGQLFLEGEVEDRADALKAEALLRPLRDLLSVDENP